MANMKRLESEQVRWPARPKRDDTIVARRRVWTSKCKRYRVVHSHILLGEGSLPDVYYANVFDAHQNRWDILGRHRTKNAAMKHCQQNACGSETKPPRTPRERKRNQ